MCQILYNYRLRRKLLLKKTTVYDVLLRLIRSDNFKMSFWCLQIFQKTNEIFSRISALAYKKRSNQKNKGTYLT